MKLFSSGRSSRLLMLATLATATLCISTTAGTAGAAGPCAAPVHFANANNALALSFTSNQHTGCTSGIAQGAAVLCARVTGSSSSSFNVLRAQWVSSAARNGDSTGGCSFMCASGDCFVGNNGLPVELLRFGVE